MRQPLQEFVTAVMVNDRLRDDSTERGHARCQPRRHAPAMERKIGAAAASCHSIPESRSIEVYQVARPKVRTSRSTMVRNVIEYRSASTAGMLCSQTCREAPDIM